MSRHDRTDWGFVALMAFVAVLIVADRVIEVCA